MTDYNIEFAHVYADKEFGEEQIRSIKVLKKIIQKLKKENKTYVLSILIDDFHPTVFRLNINRMINELKKQDINIDFIGYESKFKLTADKLIKKIPPEKLKLEHFHNHDREVLILKENQKEIGLEEERLHKPTCALLDATWQLCRLGKLRTPKKAIDILGKKPFIASNIITILPKKYKILETKVLDIIRDSGFKSSLKKIKYEFF